MRGRPSESSRPDDLPWFAAVLVLTGLAVAPFWLTRILPMQEFPQLLLFARAFRDHNIPGSPFQGAYTTGFPVAPLVLPILLLDGLGRLVGLETAGKLLWSLYAVALPAASIHLLDVLGRDRASVLLLFPVLLFSYWVTGGFFAFATGAPLLLYGLACGVRWLERPSWKRGALVGLVSSALVFWHALMLGQLLLDLGLLWLLWRADDARAKLRAILPVLPSIGLASAWMLVAVRHRPPWSPRATAWPPFLENVPRFFDPIAPIVPGATGLALLFGLLLGVASLAAPRPGPPPIRGGASFRVASPFVWLALAAVVGFLVMPAACLGVEGINNRQPWIAALLFVFAWRLPARPAARRLLLGVVAAAGAASLLYLARLFVAFDRETAGASRLIDRIGHEETLLSPMGEGGSKTFPGRPLIALELYASVRRGGLPNKSFAGYTINFIRYVGDQNPMPGLGNGWVDQPALARFDHVLLRAPSEPLLKRKNLRFEARDGEWVLMAVCGGRVAPTCP